MFKKMLPWVIMILVVVTLIVAAAFLIWDKLFSDPANDPNVEAQQEAETVEGKKMSAEEIKELSYEINDVLTNLSTGEFIKISFTFELNNENAKEEFTLLEFRIRAIIIQTLADLSPEDISGSKGNDYISATLLNKINQVLDKGKVRQVNITGLVIS